MALEDWEQRYKEEGKQAALPIPFITRIARQLKPGKALDLACGTGRHSVWLAQQGWSVSAVDGSSAAIATLRERTGPLSIETHLADLEKHEYSIAPQSWDLIVISLYLQRDLFESAKQGVKPGGVLIAVTLLAASGESKRHRLLAEELRTYFDSWEILEYFEGTEEGSSRSIARIAARKP